MRVFNNKMVVHYYFKLFNSIREECEVDFAEMELTSLFGEVKRIRNFADVLGKEPLSVFTVDGVRIQDALLHEVPFGKCQGFYGVKENLEDASKLARRLAYTREFIVVTRLGKMKPDELLKQVFPSGVVGKNVKYFENNGYILFRIITNQYFLEKSYYISKLDRNEEEIDKNVETLFSYLFDQLYRIPATEAMAVGKRLEDYFAKREEPSLYLTHYMHPYKGKFYPKMVRALLNYIYPKDKGLVMDNFAGSGTLLVEATLMGLDSVGIEINPLSTLMSNVKCYSLGLDPKKLKQGIESFLKELVAVMPVFEAQLRGSRTLRAPEYDFSVIKIRKKNIPKRVSESFKDPSAIDKAILAQQLIEKIEDSKLRNFLLLGLSGTISDLTRRTANDFVEVLASRLGDLYRRVYLFAKLNQILKIEIGNSETYIGDTRDMQNTLRTWDNGIRPVKDESMDGIVNSPPYSTALDYIRNDLPQLTILNIASSLEQLEKNMIGNPNLKYYPNELEKEIEGSGSGFKQLPESAKDTVLSILRAGRKREALRSYKFFKDMYLALKEMRRVLKKDAKAVIIIGNNHYKLNEHYKEVKNDQVIWEIAGKEGFKIERIITRKLEKSTFGMIRYESIVILQKC